MSVEAAESAVQKMRGAALEAQGSYLQSLATQWRDMANAKVRQLATELEPEVTRRLGEGISGFKQELARVVDEGVAQIPNLFAQSTDPDTLARTVRRSTLSQGVRIAHDGYKGPIEQLTQPLHDLLQTHGYSTNAIKSKSVKASYDAFSFTESDFPLPSGDVKRAYSEAIKMYGSALLDLGEARHAAAAEEVASEWDNA